MNGNLAPDNALLMNGAHRYPETHWREIQRFVVGNERDPKDLFNLADDLWEAWPYFTHGRPTEAARYRFHFGHLRSFLKPYVKWYCYQRLLGSTTRLYRPLARLSNALTRADTYLFEHGLSSLDDIASPLAFAALWEAHILSSDYEGAPLSSNAVRLQSSTRRFWEHLSLQFGAPQRIPPKTPHAKQRPSDFAADESQLIPPPVILQLVNTLGLHREGKELLNHFDHLRLCIIILAISLGRRIDEILAAPRGSGPDGPLTFYPAKGEVPGGALWFQFRPNKNGPQDQVYISPEWRDITQYCTKTLMHYSDQVRDFARPSEHDLLILVSTWNWTAGARASTAPPGREAGDYFASSRKRSVQKRATGLSYSALCKWLQHDRFVNHHHYQGVFAKWHITTDGSADGAIYHLRTHQARHTRQTAIASDPQVSLLARQRDLNHTSRDMQFAYQHTLRTQNQALLEKVREGRLCGPALPWLSNVLGVNSQNNQPPSHFQEGQPSLLDARWRNLMASNPQLLQFNRVPCGYCALPQGPEGCREYLNCTEAQEGGCQWFLTDPEDEPMLIQISKRTRQHRHQAEASAAAGRTVQAGKYEVLARRSGAMEAEALRHASQEMRERLQARKRAIEEE